MGGDDIRLESTEEGIARRHLASREREIAVKA